MPMLPIIRNKANFYLTKTECRRLFDGKKIFVFGTGVDAEQLTQELGDCVNIRAYIDNRRAESGSMFYGRAIVSLEQGLMRRNKKEPILIATYRFAGEIIEQLEDAGLIPCVDFFVYDNMQIFHSDEITERYIGFLDNIWREHKRFNTSKKILIPFDNRHDLMSVIYAYCGNYFAEKHNASIYAYFRGGALYSNASETMKNIYRAFNVEEVIDPQLNRNLQKEADELCFTVWNELVTWEDWNNITIYGIHFGTTIIRDFLRRDIPTFDLKEEKMHQFLQRAIGTIVFWYHYIFENDISAVLLADGVSWDGYIRDIAVSKGIPTYAVCYKMAKMTLDYCDRAPYMYFQEMWMQLTKEEQIYGIEWAKEHIAKRLQGGTDEVFYTNKNNFTFAEKKKSKRILEDNNKLKIIICPHIFEEDCYWCGRQIFDNNYFAWLCHLGELSEKTPDYDWYLKMHPFAQRRDMIIINMLLEKYPKIKKIPSNISPIQLKEEGAAYALTVYGTIGHEFPEIGIQVINAGVNPHSAYDFTWNPETKEEYDDLILNLESLEAKKDYEGLYQFYSLNYLYYDWEYIPFRTLFFKNPILGMDKLELRNYEKDLGTWKYEEYMKEWTQERHEQIMNQMESVFQRLDEWNPNVLYRRKEMSKYHGG